MLHRLLGKWWVNGRNRTWEGTGQWAGMEKEPVFVPIQVWGFRGCMEMRHQVQGAQWRINPGLKQILSRSNKLPSSVQVQEVVGAAGVLCIMNEPRQDVFIFFDALGNLKEGIALEKEAQERCCAALSAPVGAQGSIRCHLSRRIKVVCATASPFPPLYYSHTLWGGTSKSPPYLIPCHTSIHQL